VICNIKILLISRNFVSRSYKRSYWKYSDGMFISLFNVIFYSQNVAERNVSFTSGKELNATVDEERKELCHVL
jgi:hypothetical protein